jgi:hypothetical protein
MEKVGKFYDHLKYFTATRCILWQFGTVCVHLVHFSFFGMFGPIKIWQPWLKTPVRQSLTYLVIPKEPGKIIFE